MARQYGIDVSAYQYSDLSRYVKAGAKYVLIKLTEGTGYSSPVAYAQIRSAHKHHIYVHAYHFATFSNSVHQAKQEAKHFISRAKQLNISKKRYLALDWEAGDGNVVTGSEYKNTRAIVAFMNAVKNAGWKPMLYSGASVLRNYVNVETVIKEFGDCLWVASYPTMSPVSSANFAYFPSMPGVAIWQFTSNWKGLNVDANISLTNINSQRSRKNVHLDPKKSQKASNSGQRLKNNLIVYAPVIDNNLHYMISLRDSNGHATGKFIPTNSRWRVFGVKQINGRKYYKLGTDKQWVPAKYLKVI